MSNFLKRLLTGSVYVGIILASLLIHPLLLALTSSIIVFLALNELRTILSDYPVPRYWNHLISFFLLVSVVLSYFYFANGLSILILLLFFITTQITSVYFTFEKARNILTTSSFSLLYIVLPLFLLNLLHKTSINTGIPFSLALFILIWTNDTFAYLTGLAVGRHKLSERISPKKTWEGFFGGLITTVAVSYIFYLNYFSIGLIQWLLFGLLTSLSALFGDFIESILKRSASIKDSGTLMPGHGGILDRIDSLLLASPVIYIYLQVILIE